MPKIDVDKILRSRPVQSTEVTDPGIRPANFFSRWRDLKEAQEILSKIDRIPRAPEEAARRFFDVDLKRLADLNRRYPKELQTLLRQSPEQSPWFHLTEAALGNSKNLVAAFEKADLKTRLALFRITLFSPQVGDGPLIRELFVKLMESAVTEEEKKFVEATLHCVINKAAWGRDPRIQNKRSWLIALYHGWQKGNQELG